MFNDMIKKLKGQNKKIVFTEGEDIRVLTAAARLANEGVLIPIVLGRKDVISKLAKENKLNISKLEIIQIDQFEKLKN